MAKMLEENKKMRNIFVLQMASIELLIQNNSEGAKQVFTAHLTVIEKHILNKKLYQCY